MSSLSNKCRVLNVKICRASQDFIGKDDRGDQLQKTWAGIHKTDHDPWT